MKNIIRTLIVCGLTMTSMDAAFAKGKKLEPNCEFGEGKAMKKKHVKDEAACTAQKGKWIVQTPVVAPVTAPVGNGSGSGSVSGSGSGSGSSSGSGSQH